MFIELYHHVKVVVVVSFISDRIQQWYRSRKTFCKYQYSHDIDTLLHSAGGHQGRHKAHEADNHWEILQIDDVIFICH